ncbi:MAG: T9SS type A sorting domain-containing protein [Saprospiraceae bacterium]|nr:T9SS type A sorting domain-containing protein [Saprospiraceae bacterium]
MNQKFTFRLLGFMLAILVSNASYSQYISLPCANAFEDIQTSGTFVPNSTFDDNVTTIALPAGFNFSFYGVPQTSANISTNGNMTFNPTTGPGAAFTNTALAVGMNGIFPYWDDLNGAPGIFTEMRGVAPNRRFIIYWNKPFFGGSDPIVFEVVLFETNNAIEFRYADLNGLTGNGATIGIAGPTGTSLLQLGFNMAGVVSAGQCIRFELPVACTIIPPANVTLNNTPGLCGAIHNFAFTGTCNPITVTPPSGSLFPVGVTRVTGVNGFVSASFNVTVLDIEPPTFVPACPKGGLVTLNAGPGICEVSWDAPPFMAIDNCPVMGGMFGPRSITTVCLPPASYWSITGGANSWGVMFDLVNTSGMPLNLQLLGERAFANVPHRIWYRTAPGPHAPVQGTPAAWTLCATRTPQFGAQFTTIIDSFDLITGVVYDTTNLCVAPFFRVDSFKAGCVTLMPGETRGIYIHAPGTPGTNASLFNGCQPAQMGNAQITTPLNGATYTGGEFAAPFINSSFGFGGSNWIGVIGYAFGGGSNMVPVSQDCGAPYGPGCFFPIGCTQLCYSAEDDGGNRIECIFDVCVNEYSNPTRALACNDLVQISLDDSCWATINPDMVLEGGPYGCYDNYNVVVRDWITKAIVDRRPTIAGSQVGRQDIGRQLQVTVTDPRTGNTCWGMLTVEDKLPPILTCPPNDTIPCDVEPTPANTGIPSVYENCGGVSLSYRDVTTKGSCAVGYAYSIRRTWTAEDSYGNRSVCVQNILVSLGDLLAVTTPPNWDNIDQPMLNCDEKIDRNKNIVPHMLDNPVCLDGYILDSAYWLARPQQLDIYPNRRIPRVLGWNCIDDVNSKYFGHPNPDPVYYPQHRLWQPNNPLCWGPDTHIMWIGTGRPGGTNCHNLSVTYEDIVFDLRTSPTCDAGPVGCYKLLRKWTVMDWCTSLVGGHSQVIKVADAEGPQVLYPDSARVNMESYSCFGRWEVPPAWLIDNCSNEIHYTVEVERGTILGNETSGYVVIGMPEGIQSAWIVAEDCCGNITRKHVVINVVDRVPPQPICRTATTVSLNGNQSPGENVIRICAQDLDEGSYDNCQPHVFFKMIRMAELLGTNNGSNSNNTVACNGINGDDNLTLTGNQVYFDDCSYFCCADVGTRVMVVLRVFDVDPGPGPVTPVRMTSTAQPLHGRFSDCMVEVEVQNKAVPTVVAPPNIVVSCWFWFDIAKLTDPNDATFGRVVTDLTDRKKVVTQDLVCYKYCERNDYTGYPGFVPSNQVPKPAPNQACEYYWQYFDTAHWDNKYELTWGFDGYVLSSCGANPNITVNDLRECGQGIIQRIVSATGPNNINVTAIQTIWVVDCDPFYIDDLTCNDPRFSDVIWPNGVCTQTPVTINGCGADLSPDNPQLGRPQVINNADDNCALISIEYDDDVFTIEPDACMKVLRTWTIIDWCQYDPFISTEFGRWERLQVIKVRDQDKPVVTCNVGPCEPASIHPTLGVCVGHISLTADATDNCTPEDWLFWEYKIDAYNDRVGVHAGWDFRVGTLTERQFNAGDTVEYSHNPFADNPRNPFDASGTYPIGIHRINWFVEDGCGNVGTCETLFEIKDCKAPTPYCLTGIITVPMPASGCIDIWAKDLDHGSFDNCTAQEDLLFYFNGDVNATSITVCCDDFVNAGANDELRIEVEMWVEDEEGNRDYCKTVVIVQDNQDICPNTGSVGRITGELKTAGGEEANPVDMSLYNNGNMMKQTVGSPYAFRELDLSKTYMVSPVRNDDHANGITTQDIIAIQKHILGQQTINSPYKLIAADVNASKSITTADISELRKLILGNINEFSKVQSWTFVPGTHVFNNPLTPYDAPRVANVSFTQTTSPEEVAAPFVAIKMGDVTGDARASNASAVSSRTNGVLNIEVDEKSLVAGESYRIGFKSSDFNQIAGYQFTLKYDRNALVFEGIEAGALNVTEANFGTMRVNEGIITTSWNSNKGETVGKDGELFTLVFKAVRSAQVSSLFAITSDVTKAAAYDAMDQSKEVRMGVRTTKGVVESGIFELYQNEPNPFSKETVVSYRLPEAGAVTLSVYDVTGKVVRVYNLKGQKGLNSYQISKGDLNATGVLYYQLDAANHTATKRMVIIE